MLLNIERATDHSCLINRSGAKYKIFTVTFLIFNIIIFLFNEFQSHHPPVIPTIHMVLFMNCSLFIYHIKFHHRCRQKVENTLSFYYRARVFFILAKTGSEHLPVHHHQQEEEAEQLEAKKEEKAELNTES